MSWERATEVSCCVRVCCPLCCLCLNRGGLGWWGGLWGFFPTSLHVHSPQIEVENFLWFSRRSLRPFEKLSSPSVWCCRQLPVETPLRSSSLSARVRGHRRVQPSWAVWSIEDPAGLSPSPLWQAFSKSGSGPMSTVVPGMCGCQPSPPWPLWWWGQDSSWSQLWFLFGGFFLCCGWGSFPPHKAGCHLLFSSSLPLLMRPRMVVLSWVETQSCVYRVKSLGLRQQPCGAPVLTVSSADTRLPTLTTCGLPVKKSRIQLLLLNSTLWANWSQ